jgi:15-cis-phytoene synthase
VNSAAHPSSGPDYPTSDLKSALYVKAVARKSGSNFYLSFFSLPKAQREAITAVYAFCREVDDAVDDPAQRDPAGQVAAWREEIARTYDGKPTRPLTRSLAQAIERFQLRREYFDGILTGVSADLQVSRYASFEALSQYCYHVAGEVGLLCMEIFGYRSERLQSYAVKLGMAFQLTNILRDVGADARAGRIYIPQQDLARFGVSEERILSWSAQSSSADPRWEGSEGWQSFQNLMAFESKRARSFYQDAKALPLPAERPALRAAEIMRAVYENILGRVERRGYNVFRERIRVPTPVKVLLALKTWWECRS